MRDVFISHVEEDKSIALETALALEEAGYTTWYYERDSPPGGVYVQEFGKALEQCRAVVLIISRDSLGSDEVNQEVETAYVARKRFLPVRRDLPHEEVLARKPGWRTILGATVSVPVAPEGPSALLPQLVEGLAGPLGIEPRRPPELRELLERTRRHLTALGKQPSGGTTTTALPVSPPAPLSGQAKINVTDGAEMVYVPAGEFLMGRNESEAERPPHKVTLDGYWIYKYEVTVAQYHNFCYATGRDMPEAPSWGWKDNHPIVNVSWDDAMAYAQWAGGQLPTEAQWEKAARGTDGRKFPWGNEWDSSKCANSVGQSRSNTEPVGSFPGGVSPYGALDMSGNVWEWCADWYDANYYKEAPSRNPQGPSSAQHRVLRGGSWLNCIVVLFRCSNRYRVNPGYWLYNRGFRCVQRL